MQAGLTMSTFWLICLIINTDILHKITCTFFNNPLHSNSRHISKAGITLPLLRSVLGTQVAVRQLIVTESALTVGLFILVVCA